MSCLTTLAQLPTLPASMVSEAERRAGYLPELLAEVTAKALLLSQPVDQNVSLKYGTSGLVPKNETVVVPKR